MTSRDQPPEDDEANRMTRRAILHELHCAPGDPDGPAADKLQQVARSLVQQGGTGGRRGDQGSPRPDRRQNPARRPRNR